MRRYQSYWNRFSQPDPYDGSYNITDPQSFNRYTYAQNDPVNFVDPSGLQDPNDPPGGWPADLVTTEWIYTSAPYWTPGQADFGSEMGLLQSKFIASDPQIGGPQNPSGQAQRTPCGVNPITGQPGFTRDPNGQPGHLRPSRGGDGWWHARRSHNRSGVHNGLDISGNLNRSAV